MKMNLPRWVRGSKTQVATAGPQQDPCVVMFAKPSPSSTLLAGIPLLRRELDHLLPSSCSQQPSRMC